MRILRPIIIRFRGKSRKFKRRFWIGFPLILLLFWYYFSLPEEIFKSPVSTVVLSSDGHLLGARVATDGQWRFPVSDSIPQKFIDCAIAYEDQYFYYHPGFNPVSLFRALKQNMQKGEIISGGSTLTMQVARLSMNHPNRSVYNKITEIIRATRLEFSYSKDEILNLWACNAPFGGNVVGIEAASWRYFNRTSFELSWAETATLAVLPNAPSLIYIGKNQKKLISKRNNLLKKLLTLHKIDTLTYNLAVQEELPSQLYSIPNIAPHLTDNLNRLKKNIAIHTTIDYKKQIDIQRVILPFVENYAKMDVRNAAILVEEVETGKVLAYHGNLALPDNAENNDYFVDIITSPRSSGSTLKPILYAAAFDKGIILPTTLVADIPTHIGDYQPQNFHKDFAGLIPAGQALASSLNIPAVRLLQKFGLLEFYQILKNLNFTTINRGADTYGLSLILGGAEVNLWDLTGVYASMARVLNHYNRVGYNIKDWHSPYYYGNFTTLENPVSNQLISASAIALTMNSLLDANRPTNESGWRLFENSRKIAWKTGTSYGFRDAWAVGVTPKYAVGVWVGNADGEGKPALTGLSMAAPLLFKVFSILPKDEWFDTPVGEMIKTEICIESGYRAGPNCPTTKIVMAAVNSEKSPLCPYHKIIHLDKSQQYQVNSSCEPVSNMISKSWFVMPPMIEYYYKLKNPDYKSPPPFREDCLTANQSIIEFLYPEYGAKIYIPHDFTGKLSPIVFKATHRISTSVLYWHIDKQFLGSTSDNHEMSLIPKPGKHIITLMDDNGNTCNLSFTILEK